MMVVLFLLAVLEMVNLPAVRATVQQQQGERKVCHAQHESAQSYINWILRGTVCQQSGV